ncbi:hypothetical protein [Pseudomonas phage Astolliot]|nr:hypothetical protein [Pseudomonas phage Astolliot]
MTAPKITLHNRSILLDCNHAVSVGDEVSKSGIVLGVAQTSEVPSYGIVLQVSPDIENVFPGDIIPLPTTGVLRSFDYPGKDKKNKLAIIRYDLIDATISQ